VAEKRVAAALVAEGTALVGTGMEVLEEAGMEEAEDGDLVKGRAEERMVEAAKAAS